MDSFEEHQIQKYYEEKADGKGQHTPTDRREDVPGQLRSDFRQEAVTEQGLTQPQSGSYSTARLSGDYAGRVADVMSSLYKSNAETPFLQATLKPRYSVKPGSVTGHCCFMATVCDILGQIFRKKVPNKGDPNYA